MKLAVIKPASRVRERGIGLTALLLFGVSIVVFAIRYLASGDPLNVLLEGQSPRSELALGMREALGVSQTWYGQYAAWFSKMLQGNFGNSIRTGLPVLPELARVGVYTLTLTLGSLALTLLIAVPNGVHARGPCVHGGLPAPGDRDHERQDPVPAGRGRDRRAGVQLARHGAHGVAGGAGSRFPGHHGHRPRRRRVRASR